jgi:hypothetical protein
MEVSRSMLSHFRGKNLAIGASLGVVTLFAVFVLLSYPRANSSWVKVRTHTFKHAVIDDGINPMNCMSGPWNECAERMTQRSR